MRLEENDQNCPRPTPPSDLEYDFNHLLTSYDNRLMYVP